MLGGIKPTYRPLLIMGTLDHLSYRVHEPSIFSLKPPQCLCVCCVCVGVGVVGRGDHGKSSPSPPYLTIIIILPLSCCSTLKIISLVPPRLVEDLYQPGNQPTHSRTSSSRTPERREGEGMAPKALSPSFSLTHSPTLALLFSIFPS